MNRLLEEKRAGLAALCRRHAVRKLAVFGSALGEEFQPGRSDVDLIVEFEPMPPAERARNYFELMQALERHFSAPVDLTEEGTITNPYFQREILGTRQALYGA
jgi:predicted nucleotidyltransferase